MSFLNRLFSKNLSSDANRSLRRLRRSCLRDRGDTELRPQVEKLEDKIALAAQTFSTLDTGGLDGGRHVIVLDSNLDDLHFKVSQSTDGTPQVVENIVFDTDPNFSSPQFLQHAPVGFRDLLITSGVRNNAITENIVTSSEGGYVIDAQTAAEAGVTPPNTLSSQNAIVPGTILGSALIPDARGFDTYEFTTFRLQDEGTPQDVLVFRSPASGTGAWQSTLTITHSTIEVADDGKITIVDNNLSISGDVDNGTGLIAVEFGSGGDDPYGLWASFDSSASFASPIIPNGPSTVRLTSGLDFNSGLIVDLPGENSVIEIDSPVLQAGADNVVVLAATNVNVDAPITSNTGFFTIGSTGDLFGSGVDSGLAGNWYGGGGGDTEVEAVTLTAPVTAPEFGLVIKDDLQTSNRDRGRLYVSQTSGLLGAGSISVDATHSDIIFEGNVTGTTQSYMFRTRNETVPYQFVTNQGEGLPTGTINGTTVDITLANDEAISASDSVTHNIDLDTDVVSLRIAAAGDDSFGLSDRGVVTNVSQAPAGGSSDISLSQDVVALGVEIGDVVQGNTANGVVPTPAVIGVFPDDIGVPTGSGSIRFASPLTLAAGSTFTVESSATVVGFPVLMVNPQGIAAGQTATYDDPGLAELGKSLGTVEGVDGLAASFSLPATTEAGATGVLAGTIITFKTNSPATVRADTVVEDDATETVVSLFDNLADLGVAQGMTVILFDGVAETLTTLEVSAVNTLASEVTIVDPANPDTAPTFSQFDQLFFQMQQIVGEDRVTDQVTLSSILGVTEGMNVSGELGGAAVISTDTGDEISGLVVTLDQDVPDEWAAGTTLTARSPTLTVEQDVAQSVDVRVTQLTGVSNDATVDIPQAAIPDGVVIVDISEDGQIITVSEDASLLGIEEGASLGFARAQQNDFNRYAIDVTEQSALNLDAAVSSGGAVSIAAGGDLTVNASLRSHGDVALTSTGNVVGNAWLVTRDGTMTVSGSSVTLNGDVQVLASPYDESITDVTISATNGNIAFTGSVGAVNRVLVDQAGTGNVSVQGIAIASEIEVYSEGSVNLSTDADRVFIDAEGPVEVAEKDIAAFDIETPARVTLSAEGVDEDGQAALLATVRASTNLVLSAPSGSIEVSALSPSTMTIGESELLVNASSTLMQAAGSVSIRSGQEEIVVLDAPIAGDGRLQARAVASGGNLFGIYAVNNPGLTPSTLTGALPGNLNDLLGLPLKGLIPGFGDAGDQVPLRVRDTLLLVSQGDSNENGLYQIVSLGSTTTAWSLRRLGFADTTLELPANSRIKILDGPNAGQVYRVGDYSNIINETPLRVAAGRNREAGELTVAYATENAINGTFNSNAGEIEGTTRGLVLNGAGVNDGELVLVRQGTINENVPEAPNWNNDISWPSNGVYRKSTDTVGGVWKLSRFQLPSTAVVVDEATVVVSKGIYRTSVTGETFTVSYDGLGLADVALSEETVSTSIGSFDPRDATTFVVTTAGATNNEAGSLGKMLSLVQANNAADLTGEALEQTVQFGNVLGDVRGPTGTILLTQELPTINKPFILDTTSRYPLSQGNEAIVIDGSRITSTRGGSFVTNETTVNGLEYKGGSGTSLAPVPEEATRGELRGVRVVGFRQGGAVVVDGASNLLIEDLTIGLDEANEIKPSLYGIQVTGNSGVDGPVTLLSNSIFASNILTGDPANPLAGAGVQIDGSAQGVQVVDATIGSPTGSNTVGIVVDSSNDNNTVANSIGANPMPADYVVTLDTIDNKSSLKIQDNLWAIIGEDLYLGQTLIGDGFEAGTEIIHINPEDKTIVVSERMNETGSSIVTLGVPGKNSITENFFGVDLRSGNVRMVNSSVDNNVISGVRVGVDINADSDGDGANDVQNALWAQIGAGIALNESEQPDPQVRSSASNEIYSNGRYGIQFRSGITGMTVSNGTTTDISIQGNYVGTNTGVSLGLENGSVQNGRFDYWWDASNTGENASPPEDPLDGVDADFEALLVSADPLGDTPAADVNGNISADVGGENGVGDSGGSTGDTGGNDGIVHTPIRR